MEVLSVYKGNKWDDTCISEIAINKECSIEEYPYENEVIYNGKASDIFYDFINDIHHYDIKYENGIIYRNANDFGEDSDNSVDN